MLTQLVQEVQKKTDPVRTVSTVIGLNIDWLTGHEIAQQAIWKMDNDQKKSFALQLIETICDANSQYTSDKHKEKKDLATKELTTLFGEAVLNDQAIKGSNRGFFFSLTRDGHTFRAWYSQFGSVTRGHFDSCGQGCLFSASCECEKTLNEWLQPFVNGKVAWKNQSYGTVWIGWAR